MRSPSLRRPFSRNRGDPDAADAETPPFRWAGQNRGTLAKRAHLTKAVLYGIQNFYAFMIM